MAGEPDFRDFDLTLTDRELEEFLSVMEMQQTDGGAGAMELPCGPLGLSFGSELGLGLQLQPHSNSTASPESSEDTAMANENERGANGAHSNGSSNHNAASMPPPQQQHDQQQPSAPPVPPAKVKHEDSGSPNELNGVLQALAVSGGMAGQQLLTGLPPAQQAAVLCSLPNTWMGPPATLQSMQGLPSPSSLQQSDSGGSLHSLQQQQQQQPQQRQQQPRQQRQSSAETAVKAEVGVSHSTVEKQRRDRLNSLIEELSDIVPASEAKYNNSNDGASVRRPKHVILSDTINLLRSMQEKLRLGEQENSMLRQHGAMPSKTNGTHANGSSDAVSLPVAPESAALATGVVVEQGRGCLYVKVNCKDRKGLLSDLVTALKSLPLIILTAAITTTPDGKVHDVFEVQLDDSSVCAEDIHAAINTAIYASADSKRGKRHRSAQSLQ